jgi:TPR repeat protein
MSHVPCPPAAVELHESALAAQREERWEAAEELFRQAFEAGHPVAAYDLGAGLLDRGDRAGAKTWYRRAAEHGVPAAAFEVGYLEERAGDLDKAERWYRQAAEGGHSGGILNLGVLLENRGEVPAALDLYHRAWDLGDARAAFNIGKIHDNDGKGDQDKAAEWYERAAERGNGGAAYNLGHVRHDQGDLAAQVAAWQRAADLGHPKAAYSLGVMFREQGDQDQAAAWLRRSVEEFGHRQAAGMLADICERRGDRDEARFWRDLPFGLGAYSSRFETFGGEGAAAAIHRQDMLNEALGDGDVHFDLGARTMTVDGTTYRGVTLLGSFSHESRSWLWAWANEHYRDDDPAIASLAAIRAYGREHDVPADGRVPGPVRLPEPAPGGDHDGGRGGGPARRQRRPQLPDQQRARLGVPAPRRPAAARRHVRLDLRAARRDDRGRGLPVRPPPRRTGPHRPLWRRTRGGPGRDPGPLPGRKVPHGRVHGGGTRQGHHVGERPSGRNPLTEGRAPRLRARPGRNRRSPQKGLGPALTWGACGVERRSGAGWCACARGRGRGRRGVR